MLMELKGNPMKIIYIVITFFATVIGSISGLGGGIMIKPSLDLIGFHTLTDINFLSSCSVFVMALYSTYKQVKSGVSINFKMISIIAVGSILGSKIGNIAFSYTIQVFGQDVIQRFQSLFLVFLLSFVLITVRKKWQLFEVKNPFIMALIGCILGAMSAFLGIGGGPINVAVYMLFFSVDIKVASIFSLASILFSQGPNLLFTYMENGFKVYDLSYLIYMIPTAIIGASVGTFFNRKMPALSIERVFSLTVSALILLNTYNFIK